MAETVLATHDLRKSFGALAATDGVSIDLRAGEIHAIIGPNGAGKSTLIAQICGALRPDAGRVAFLGQDVTGLSTQARARMGLARTFQTSALAMEDTVLQNVLLGALGASGRPWQFFGRASRDGALRDRAEAALEAVDLAELSELRTAELSHGQRRQLEVAVALTLAPRAFVMDEPMAGLGQEGSKRLTGFLDGLRAQAPILLVEHDMDAVFALADRISVLVYGRVIATGTVDEIRRDPRVREAYLGDAA
ncbi:MAG: ABC transporter ATP-binding protein [Rhodobacteraceae bacterium]|jgi:branched-chain amino acid transport system ATP-binding protein|uniref:Amino acid/amide ABC transporter ATP-binding protein 1, HAAT family n=1 Tax=Salipiger profundus TaxID=1229727 RepID=A0A1U7D189_9RHOB|nr:MULTISPECIES: ABC transporter ATP-binding protein [Salipiger]APX21911.1 amino acid/amide ABC transporter ATP-binding protein 1, HAAT family [Salipiger profundus]MAB08091.1 ABC transporter ATP-binding protein [Paracoccaceae bacterium]GGA06181.1 ABC transporter ATP-binding protein [Salipiger profundus]SFC36849.1 amino acid/amide ABC transporter ATP-binding protein 1, HAAT family [Salipiger profundus]